MRIIVTGGAGFIGSAMCRFLVRETDDLVLNIDKLTYAGTLESLREVTGHNRYRFAQADICDRPALEALFEEFRPDAVIHLAAESHVDRSIVGSSAFVHTNVVGTLNLLEVSRLYWGDGDSSRRDQFRFLHVSTDEVDGSLLDGRFTEETPYSPR